MLPIQENQDKSVIGIISPLFLSLYFVPITFVGSYGFPLLLIGSLLLFKKIEIEIYQIYIMIVSFSLLTLLALFDLSKAPFIFSIVLALFCSNLVAKSKLQMFLGPTLIAHIIFVFISYISILTNGDDFLPNLIYGESRHGIHKNDILNYRISGIYQEPATFGLHMLLLSIWSKKMNPNRIILANSFSILAILSFSSLTFLAILKVINDNFGTIKNNRGIIGTITLILLGFTISSSYYEFFISKLDLYMRNGIINSKRFEFLNLTANKYSTGELNLIFGHEMDAVQKYVVYDLGPVISTTLILGIPGLILATTLIFRTKISLLNYVILLATKASINNPLLWIALLKKEQK